ncbi:MAG: hypothetical protein JSS52_05755 [Proteobacteria bacterium]|nr:hypothetical protein [Pseudomonadota bacterium]
MPTSPSWGSRKRCQGQLTQGQLTQVTQVKTGTTTLASNASYYPNGALAQFTYGNGIAHTMTQNARQLPSHSVDGSVLDLSTVFDENGNVAAITDNTASARQTRSMSYDGLDRLTATTSPMFGTASYAYDPQDNLTRVQVTGGSQPRDHYYCYNASNQLAFVRSGPNCTGTTSPAVIALAYDVQGNLSIKNGASYAFDFGNRLRTTAGQSYRYDAQGRRVRQDVAGSQLQYSQYAADGRLVWQRDETTNQRIANAYLAGSLLAEISRPLTGSTTTIRYLHTDALGSPIAKTSASGAIIETSEYEPYGRLLNRANDNRAGYTGHVMDAASGLTYMQQRYYDPAIGAFLSVDPVTAYSNPVGAFNRYWYANGNPYRFVDPDGRQSKPGANNSPCGGGLHCDGHYESGDDPNEIINDFIFQGIVPEDTPQTMTQDDRYVSFIFGTLDTAKALPSLGLDLFGLTVSLASPEAGPVPDALFIAKTAKDGFELLDGMRGMLSGLDGRERPLALEQAMGVFGGERGAAVGRFVSAFVSLRGSYHAWKNLDGTIFNFGEAMRPFFEPLPKWPMPFTSLPRRN